MSLEPNPAGDTPEVAPSASVHPSATIIGNVRIGAHVYVGPRATIRADEPGPDGEVAPIVIGREANVQDGVIIHALGGTSVRVGEGTSVAHGAVVHGPCEIGPGSFIGFNSVVFDADLGEKVVVMHGACVEGVDVPAGLFIPSMRAVRSADDVSDARQASEEELEFAADVRSTNMHLAEVYEDLGSGREESG